MMLSFDELATVMLFMRKRELHIICPRTAGLIRLEKQLMCMRRYFMKSLWYSYMTELTGILEHYVDEIVEGEWEELESIITDIMLYAKFQAIHIFRREVVEAEDRAIRTNERFGFKFETLMRRRLIINIVN